MNLIKGVLFGWHKSDCFFQLLEKQEVDMTQDQINVEFVKAWNTRPAPPIGRCGTCKHSMSQEIYCELGHLWALKSDDYCSYYEPREEEL